MAADGISLLHPRVCFFLSHSFLPFCGRKSHVTLAFIMSLTKTGVTGVPGPGTYEQDPAPKHPGMATPSTHTLLLTHLFPAHFSACNLLVFCSMCIHEQVNIRRVIGKSSFASQPNVHIKPLQCQHFLFLPVDETLKRKCLWDMHFPRLMRAIPSRKGRRNSIAAAILRQDSLWISPMK